MLDMNDIKNNINVQELVNDLRNNVYKHDVFEKHLGEGIDCSVDFFKEGTKSYKCIYNSFCDKYTCSQCRALVATFIKENYITKKNNIYLWK